MSPSCSPRHRTGLSRPPPRVLSALLTAHGGRSIVPPWSRSASPPARPPALTRPCGTRSGSSDMTSTLLIAGVLFAVPVTASSAQTPPPVVGCALRTGSVTPFEQRRDIVRGPFALVTLARLMPRLSRQSYRPRAGRLKGIKLPVGVRAGHTATLRISPGQREHAALVYGLQPEPTADYDHGVLHGDEAVTFKPCTGDTAGPVSGWAGALNVTGPRCIRLQVWTDGARRPDIRLPLGRRCH